MKYNVGDIIPFEQIQEATDYVNSIDGNYYLEDFMPDEQGRMMLIVRQLPPHVETAEEIQKRLTDGVQNWMDSKVQERNYDNVHTCVGTYLYSPVEKFRLEAEAVRDWVSYVWAKCYEILAQVEAGERGIPTIDELLAELPKLEW